MLNAGNWPAPAVLTVYGPLNAPSIENVTTGEVLAFNLSIGAGEFLVIDLDSHTVRLNGTADRRGSLIRPSWWLLRKGTNILRLQGASPVSPATAFLAVAWRSAWI